MTVEEFVGVIAGLSGMLFVVTSMLGLGASLTMGMIVKPLKNAKLVILALVANFVLAPAFAYAITVALPIPEDQKIGLIVLGCAAGAPFLPKLAQSAKGPLGFSVGMMVLLMVVTIVYLPIVMPLLLSGVSVSPLDIIDFIGSWGLLALVVFLVGSVLLGMLLGGRDPGTRAVMGLGTAQRNISAAIVVVTQNFAGTDSLPFVLVAAILGLLILLPIATWLGGKQDAPAAATALPQT